ncbi:MAG TPA: ThuA domain-containing protein [Candidatus Acidoferrales bacterium]|jgi:type 1 glutamine amidotransferase|nr:ThuA domain-containing protein [Candidatus Acidoferrales bacterium]
MKSNRPKSMAVIAAGTLAGILGLAPSAAQAPAGGAGANNAGNNAPGQGGGLPGRGQGQGPGNAAPGRGSASVRWEAWSAMRTAASTVLGWQVGIAAEPLRELTFFNAVEKADLLGVANIEGSSTQKVSLAIPKYVTYNLAPGEIAAVKDRLNVMSIRMAAYRVPTIGPGEDASHKLFEFAKTIGVGVIVCERIPDALPMVDRLANEFSIDVALRGTPSTVLAAVNSLSNRVGVWGDTGVWLQDGLKPLDAVTQLKDRLLVLNVEDRSALGKGGKDVPLGTGVAGLPGFFRDMYRMQVKPALITVSGAAAPDPAPVLTGTLEAFEKAIHPLMGEQVGRMARAAAIRGPDRLSPEERQAILAALPKEAPAKPRKPRKLLVLDVNIAYPGHRSIPNENFGIEQMGKQTGAYEAIFSNDLDNLKYDKIKQFDAVFLNNTVGQIFVDPEVRDGLTRFVREGGGLAGNHGTSHADMDWPEFSEMIGVRRGVHRENTEQAWIKIDDPHSPLTAAFDGQEFLYQDEFFRFPNPPYSRDKLHILLAMDVDRTDMNQGRPCASPCVRPDADYAVSWIRSYGKGRVFFAILGHNPTVFTTPPLARYFLAGIQFILGDLDADTTPSGRLASAKAAPPNAK